MEVTSRWVGLSAEIIASRVGVPLITEASRVGAVMAAASSRVGKPMAVSCSLVCAVHNDNYLRVTPDVIWLDPNDATVFVESNVDWIIE